MKHLVIGLCGIIMLAGGLSGQQNSIWGRVYVHNSKTHTGEFQFLSNVEVLAPQSSGSISDSEGYFELNFVGLATGESVWVKAEKPDWEVVNLRALRRVAVGQLAECKVYMAPEGEIDLARVELMEISLESLRKRYRAILKRLHGEATEAQKVIQELEAKLNLKIADRLEAETLLNLQLARLEARIPYLAKELAQKNLDFASESYLRAYRQFEQGEVEQAIDILERANLDAISEGVPKELEALEEDLQTLQAAIRAEEEITILLGESYCLSGISHLETGNVSDGLNKLWVAVEILRALERPFMQLYLTEWEMANALLEGGNTDSAMVLRKSAFHHAVELQDSHFVGFSTEAIASVYGNWEELDSALLYMHLSHSWFPDPKNVNFLTRTSFVRSDQMWAQNDFLPAIRLLRRLYQYTLNRTDKKELNRRLTKWNRKYQRYRRTGPNPLE